MRTSKKHRITLLASVALSTLLAGCGGPFVLLPGGALEGTTAAAPSDWAFTDEIDTIQLETNPAEPYSVNIWVVTLDEALYVHAGASRTSWVENMEADANVRLQADESVYELAAARVESQDEFDRFVTVYEEKYGNPPRNPDVAEAYLFRLVSR